MISMKTASAYFLVFLLLAAPVYAVSSERRQSTSDRSYGNGRVASISTVKPKPSPSKKPAPTPAPAVSASVATVLDFVSQMESQIHARTNEARAQNGLPPLSNSTSIAAVARTHSLDMLVNDYFTHNDSSGCDPGCRLTRAGYAWSYYGENIYMMWGNQITPADAAKKIVDNWMASPAHRANILKASFTHEGVGVAVRGTTMYVTSDYATPR